MPIRKGIEISQQDAELYDKLIDESEYYDRIQMAYKLKLNSLYGALGNENFRFYNLSNAASVTSSGRLVLLHQCAKANELLNGTYEPEGKSIIYGDSVAYDSKIITSNGEIEIHELFTHVDYSVGDKEYCNLFNIDSLTYDKETKQTCFKPIKYVMRHKINKQMYRVWTTNATYVDVTEDHSLIGFVNNEPIEVKPTELNDIELLCVTNSGFHRLLNPINVEKIEYDNYVYDIEVEDTHMFFANNILVHNTDSTYFNTHADSDDESITIADIVAKKVNESFQSFMQDTFLCQPNFDNKIKCGREIVADSGIFVTKKRYMLHVIDKEGQKVDETKIMGLELKKTTIPKPIALKLEGYITRLLKGEDWLEISKEVVDYKDELIYDNVINIGIPIGVKKMEEYTSDWKINQKTRLPGHVSASINWNRLLEEYKDHGTPKIYSGMKIKVFYLKKQNYMGRFKSIAVPSDLEELPDWFINHIEPMIDKSAQIQRLVDKPLENIIKALGWVAPTKQSVYNDTWLNF